MVSFPFFTTVRSFGRGEPSRSHDNVTGDSEVARQSSVTSSSTLRVIMLGGAIINRGTSEKNVENKILSSNCLGRFQKTTCRWSLRLPLRSLRQFKLRTSYDDSERWNIYWFQDTEVVGFLFSNWRCKCYTLNVHWFAETVYEVNNSRYA